MFWLILGILSVALYLVGPPDGSIEVMSAVVGAGAAAITTGGSLLQGIFGGGGARRDREQRRDLFIKELREQARQFGLRLSHEQEQAALNRAQQQGFFDSNRQERAGIRRTQIGEADRLLTQGNAGVLTDQDIDRIGQQENLRVGQDVAGFAGKLSRFGPGIFNQPGARSALLSSLAGGQQRVRSNLLTNQANQRFGRAGQIIDRRAGLLGGL